MTSAQGAAAPDRLHLVVDLSAHGYGHLAMTAPVIHRLRARVPHLQVTVRCAHPAEKLAEHFGAHFAFVRSGTDLGMAMGDALSVDADASFRYYRDLHSGWASVVSREAEALAAQAPTHLLSNISYVSLAAAARAEVPAAALCCLNWGDIFRHYCRDRVGADAIERQIRDAYASALAFVAPSPAMRMPRQRNLLPVGPIARAGSAQADVLRARLRLDQEVRLALLSLGGVPYPIDVSQWPRLGRWRILTGMPVEGHHPDVMPAEAAQMPYIDLFASVDAIVTKLGYGTVAEAAINGRPVLYVPRDGWPEEPVLVGWLEENGRAAAIGIGDLREGTLVPALDRLVAIAPPAVPRACGADEAAAHLVRFLHGTLAD